MTSGIIKFTYIYTAPIKLFNIVIIYNNNIMLQMDLKRSAKYSVAFH